VPLAPLTTLGIGGEAEWLVTPTGHGDLTLALDICRRHGVPWRVLGGGSNVLVDDAGVAGAVIMPLGVCFEYLTVSGERMVAGGAAPLPKVLQQAADWGLSGLEPLAGIPGRLAGAVVGNAGGRYGDIGSVVSAVVGYTGEGERRRLAGADLCFGYRESGLGGLLVTAVELLLRAGMKQEIFRRMADIIDERRRSQPLGQHSAGCMFRNPPGAAAGELIDRAGLKGLRVGGAEISTVHANYIVNLSGATCEDVLTLARRARDTVRERFGVVLELEVRLWSERASF